MKTISLWDKMIRYILRSALVVVFASKLSLFGTYEMMEKRITLFTITEINNLFQKMKPFDICNLGRFFYQYAGLCLLWIC